MKKVFLLIAFVFVTFVVTKADDIQTIKTNYVKTILTETKSERDLIEPLIRIEKEEYCSDQIVVELMDRYPISSREITALVENIKPNGSWPDINYDDQGRSGWQPKKHVERILLLAKAYRSQSSSYYRSGKLQQAIRKTLAYWFGSVKISPNWWYNQIGIPKTMGAIAILMEEELTPAEKAETLKVMNQSKFGMTGQNKVWLAGNVLVRGLIENDIALVKAARDTIVSEIRISDNEGIRPDGSFHQHGAQLQFGNYGAAYIASMSFWSQILAGTRLGLQQSQLDILSKVVNDGFARVLWRGYMDVNALGRQFFKQAQRHKAFSVGFSASQLMNADTRNASLYKELLDNNFHKSQQPQSIIGLHHFPMSDLTVQRRPTWMASVKMSSPRVVGAEAGNGDNLLGYYLADGATYIYVDGNEYDNIFAAWDWRRIPGITSYQTSAPLKVLDWGGYHNRSSFVGNINDGQSGITAMNFDRDGLKAHKAWIFTNDFVLCMGSGIESDTGYVVTTSIDQRIMKGDLRQLVNQKWTTITNSDFGNEDEIRFFHDKTGYIVINPLKGKAVAQRRTGSWKQVMNMYPSDCKDTKEVVSIWLDHGKDPKGATYLYLILPATTTARVKQFDTGSIKVNSNTKQFQSVTIGNITYLAAYPLADVEVANGVRMSSTNTGLFMIKKESGRTQVSVVDPTQSQTSLSITFNGVTKTALMPDGDLKGTPVTVWFD